MVSNVYQSTVSAFKSNILETDVYFLAQTPLVLKEYTKEIVTTGVHNLDLL